MEQALFDLAQHVLLALLNGGVAWFLARSATKAPVARRKRRAQRVVPDASDEPTSSGLQ